MTRWAVLAPIPFMDWIVGTSPLAMASLTSDGDREDNMVRAVLAPTPETEINKRNTSRSALSAKPNKVCESSFTSKSV